MYDKKKNKTKLIFELEELRKRNDKLKILESEQKNREEALRKSEEKYRILFETMAQGVVYQDDQDARENFHGFPLEIYT